MRSVKGIDIKSDIDMTIECAGTLTLRADSIVIEGPITSNAGLTNTGGAVSSNGKVLDTHTHPGDSGGTTGGPN
jgi:phage baseplate assembly protein gpV